MFDAILARMRAKIHTGQYVMSDHAEDEMSEDGLTVFDVEAGILTGEIIERQKDKITGEWKYLVRGRTISDEVVFVVGKLSLTRKLVVITVYLE